MSRVYSTKNYPDPKTLVLPVAGWPHGLDTLVNPNRIQNDELAEAINVAYSQYGVLSKRAGTTKIVQLPAAVQGFGTFNKRNTDGSITKYFCAVAGGLFYTIDPRNKIATHQSGATFHATNRVVLKQGMNWLYIFDGASAMTKWDGTSFLTNTPIATPTSPAVAKTGSATGSTTYYYRVTASNGVGETTGTTEVNLASMPASLSTSTYATLSWTASTGAVTYNIYRATSPTNETYLASTTTTTYVDQDQDRPQQSLTIIVPTDNTTQGPIFTTGTIYKNAILGVDKTDRTKVWFSAGGDKIDSFSPGDGGGFYAYHPETGEPVNGIEVFAGLGRDYAYFVQAHKIGQAAFDTAGGLSVSDVNLSVGGVSDASLVPFENDMAFWSPYGGYTLRMEPNLVNVLRIAELTARVHPTYVNPITQSALPGICGIYDKANHVLLWSLPNGATTNNTSLAYDPVYVSFSEYRGIAATAFGRFVDDANTEVTYGGDSAGNVFQLFAGASDMGTPITFHATTKTFDMDAPYAYKFIERLWLIFGNINAQNLQVTLVQDGTSVLKTASIASGSGNTGWDQDRWDSQFWDASSGTTVSINNRLVQRYADIQKDLFSIQVTYDNTSTTDSFEILGLYILYQASQQPPPSTMRIP